MIVLTLWEHEHAYQPRRLIDAYREEEVSAPGGVIKRIMGRTIKERNLFRVALAPGSAYDEIVRSLDQRSLDIEPITLSLLAKHNPKAYQELKRRVLEGRAAIVATAYSHPILPLMYEDSLVNAMINIRWSIELYLEEFLDALVKGDESLVVGWWFPECAYKAELVNIIYEELVDSVGKRGLKVRGVTLYLILDETQGWGVDPSKVYRMEGRPYVLVLFRDHALSDAISFSNDYMMIMEAIRKEISRYEGGYVGLACDAECYGGYYYSYKPRIFEEVRLTLSKSIVDARGRRVSFSFRTADDIVREELQHDLPNVKVADYTSWSDYFYILDPYAERPSEGIIATRVGGLLRWSGVERKEGKATNKTYFIVFLEEHKEGKVVRVINSIWKVAFNKLRRDVANFISDNVMRLLEEVSSSETAIDVLKGYWKVVSGREGGEDYVEGLRRRGLIAVGSGELKAFSLLLEAYRLACQDAYISCPTFWPSPATEPAWTSLALLVTGLIKLAEAFSLLNIPLVDVEEVYRRYFLEFGKGGMWLKFIRYYDFQLLSLMKFLEKGSRSAGYDLRKEAGKSDVDVRYIAKELYEKGLKRFLYPVYPWDVNPFLVKYAFSGLKGDEWRAKLYEWRKAIDPRREGIPIPRKVGLLHMRYLPDEIRRHLLAR